MRRHTRFFSAAGVLSLALLLLTPGVPAAATGPEPTDGGGPRQLHFPLMMASARSTRFYDEELVLLQSNGRIKVVDPYVPSGQEALSWQSSSTGWTGVVLGDVNGDGDQEVLAFKDGRAELFDPVLQSGQQMVYGEWNISPYIYYDMATGDIDADGRDEIVLLRSDSSQGGAIRSRLLVFDGNQAGTGWTRILMMEHGTRWDDVALGHVNADDREDIGLIRDEDNRILILNPSNWSVLHEATYNFAWLDLEIINTHKSATGDRSEVVLSRSEVLSTLPSLLVFRWTGGTTLSDIWQGHFYPYFSDIEGADLNGDGDEEIIMYRDRDDVEITLSSRNISGAGMRSFEPSGSNSPRGGWLNMKAGDLEGDGRDEVILVRSGKYRIYDQPEASDHYYEADGSYQASFGVGDLGR